MSIDNKYELLAKQLVSILETSVEFLSQEVAKIQSFEGNERIIHIEKVKALLEMCDTFNVRIIDFMMLFTIDNKYEQIANGTISLQTEAKYLANNTAVGDSLRCANETLATILEQVLLLVAD